MDSTAQYQMFGSKERHALGTMRDALTDCDHHSRSLGSIGAMTIGIF